MPHYEVGAEPLDHTLEKFARKVLRLVGFISSYHAHCSSQGRGRGGIG